MRPLVAHCHLGLARLYQRAGRLQQGHKHLATAMTMYREIAHDVLARAGRSRDEGAGMSVSSACTSAFRIGAR